jgi:hypothetical protein
MLSLGSARRSPGPSSANRGSRRRFSRVMARSPSPAPPLSRPSAPSGATTREDRFKRGDLRAGKAWGWGRGIQGHGLTAAASESASRASFQTRVACRAGGASVPASRRVRRKPSRRRRARTPACTAFKLELGVLIERRNYGVDTLA